MAQEATQQAAKLIRWAIGIMVSGFSIGAVIAVSIFVHLAGNIEDVATQLTQSSDMSSALVREHSLVGFHPGMPVYVDGKFDALQKELRQMTLLIGELSGRMESR